jgi:hypothetical protein
MFTLGEEVLIEDECRIFRMVRQDRVTPGEGGGIRPSSQAFTDSDDDGKMSVFIEDEILAEGYKPADLLNLDQFPGYMACWWEARTLRALLQEIERDPIDFFPGHGLVGDTRGTRSLGTRRQLAKAAHWLDSD